MSKILDIIIFVLMLPITILYGIVSGVVRAITDLIDVLKDEDIFEEND